MSKKIFVLDEEQYETINKWAANHDCPCRLPDGRPSRSCCGGEISIIFTPSTVGTFISAKCICGARIQIQ